MTAPTWKDMEYAPRCGASIVLLIQTTRGRHARVGRFATDRWTWTDRTVTSGYPIAWTRLPE